MAEYCDSLTGIHADLPAPLAVMLLSQGVHQLTNICLQNDILLPDVVLAILNHQVALECIRTFKPSNFESNEPPAITTPCPTTRWAIQMLPRLCTKLKIFSMALHEMDMDDIEKGEWMCRELTTLNIRIRGLDTRNKINRAIQLWFQSKKDGNDMTFADQQSTRSIEERVARRLSKFEKLNMKDDKAAPIEFSRRNFTLKKGKVEDAMAAYVQRVFSTHT
ncbi:hypothetical protein BGX21_009681 [Mortierella sp. AD011]|nr:hypothetical protein BGX21_009681 [Mortierella sp. AD011]